MVKRWAIIDGGTVLNIVLAEQAKGPDWIEAGPNAEPGGTYAAGNFARRAKSAAERNAQAMDELQQIDIRSVRAMREWIAAQPNAPQFLLDHETAAQAARAKLQ